MQEVDFGLDNLPLVKDHEIAGRRERCPRKSVQLDKWSLNP